MKRFLAVLLVFLTEVPAQAAPWQPFTALGESADGKALATGGFGGEVLWWEVSTGEVLRRWQIEDRPVTAVDFDPSGLSLTVALADGRALQLVVTSNEPKGLAAATLGWRNGQSPMSGTQASHGGVLARGFPDGTIVVSGLDDVGEVSWKGHLSAVTGLAWSPDGRVLSSCSFDGTLAQWDPRTGKLLSRL